MYKAKVQITLKKGVLDPQGEAIKGSLHSMDFFEVKDVRVGKLINLLLEGKNPDELENRVEAMCQRLLANPVIENYAFEIMEVEQK